MLDLRKNKYVGRIRRKGPGMENHVDKPWDDSLRTLVRANPQAFIWWLLGEALFIRELPHKLKTWKQEVDALLLVLVNGQELLLHIEFQTYHDSTMAERLLRYNVLARSEYGLPVVSWVIYLLRDGNVPQSPLRWTTPGGQEVLEFHFGVIEVAKLSPEELLHMAQPGLLPLLPLTRGGAKREVVQTMFAGLEAAGRTDLMSIGGTIASLVFNRENPVELDWLNRRLHKMHDLLRESPFFQEILQEGREEGLQEGLQKGLQEGLQKLHQEKLEALRETLLKVVQARFPKVVRLAKGQAAIIDDLETLEDLIVKVSTAQNAKEAKRYLLDEEDEDD